MPFELQDHARRNQGDSRHVADQSNPRSKPDSYFYSELLPWDVRLKLLFGFLGSVLVSVVETASILALAPLLQVLAGVPLDSGTTGTIWRLLGSPDTTTFLGYLLGFIVVGFILKDVFSAAFRWWMIGFTARQQMRTSARIFSYLLRAPYSVHLVRGTPDMLRSTGDAVSLFWGRTIGASLGAATEAISIALIVTALLAVMPLQTVIMAVYFGLAATLFIRIVRPRLKRASEESLEAGREAMEYMLWGFGGIKEIQIRHSQQHFVAGYLRWSKQGIRAFRTNAFLIDLPKYILEILLILGLAVLIISVTASGSGPQLFGTLGLTAAAAFRLLPSITRMVASVVTARSGEPGKELLFDELDRESQHPLHPDSATKDTGLASRRAPDRRNGSCRSRRHRDDDIDRHQWAAVDHHLRQFRQRPRSLGAAPGCGDRARLGAVVGACRFVRGERAERRHKRVSTGPLGIVGDDGGLGHRRLLVQLPPLPRLLLPAFRRRHSRPVGRAMAAAPWRTAAASSGLPADTLPGRWRR